MHRGNISKYFSIIMISVTILVISGIWNSNAAKAADPNVGTRVSGILTTDTVWTKGQSPYILDGTVQVGATLQIEPGVEVIGNNNDIQVFGKLIADGTQDEKINFNWVHIKGGNDANNFSMDIQYSNIINSTLYPATGTASYGSLILKHSYIENLRDSMYLWYPKQLCEIDGNMFVNSAGISTSGNVKITNNLFKNPENHQLYYSPSTAINVWNSNPVTIEYNSFDISNGATAISLQYNSGKVDSAKNNYWGTTDVDKINNLIYDKNDDYSLAQYIDFQPVLTEPDPNTPILPTPSKPVFNTITNNDTVISGKTDPYAQMEIRFNYRNSDKFYSFPADSSGNFQFNLSSIFGIPELPAGTVIKGTSYKYGSSAEADSIVQDVIPPDPPQIDRVHDQQSLVVGKAEPGSTIEAKVDGNTIGTGTTDSSGSFQVQIPIQSERTVIDFYAIDEAGNKSDATAITVSDGTPPQLTVDGVTDASAAVTGKSEAGTTISVTIYNSGLTELGSTVANPDGSFAVPIPKQSPGTTLYIEAKDAAGNPADTAVYVQDGTPPNPPSVNEVSNISTELTGTAEPGSMVWVYLKDWNIGTTWAGQDGRFSVPIWGQYFGDQFTVWAMDNAGNKSDSVNVTVAPSGWLFNYQDNAWYYYDPDTFQKHTGWLSYQGQRYYLGQTGARKSGWALVSGKWYYLDGNGVMKTGWFYDNAWYYLNSNGDMATGWIKYGNRWYYMDNSGVMKTGWIYDGAWYYLNSNGDMGTGWINYGNHWYYLNSNGKMATGWINYGNSWYYLDNSGVMKTGWIYDGGKWYYLYSSGVMAYNTKIGSYRLGTDGAWIS